MSTIPHAGDRADHWRKLRASEGGLLVAVDFDGTLAPIVERPEDAAPLPAGRAALRRLAEREDTVVAVVSGRGLEDVRGRLDLEGIFYAGNHGMEIDGPAVRQVHPTARKARPALSRCVERISGELAEIEGSQLEDKGLTLSVHYRRVPDDDGRERVRRLVREHCGEDDDLRITEGKAVVEIRPDIDWDKGRATRFLLDTLAAKRGDQRADRPALFLGDDTTDEDGFRAVAEWEGGIAVGDPPPEETAAASYLRTPEEVAEFLAALAESTEEELAEQEAAEREAAEQ